MKYSKVPIWFDSLRASKAGERRADSEDAMATPSTGTVVGSARFGLSDGVSASAQSKTWARILTSRFVGGQLDFWGRPRLGQIAECRQIWNAATERRLGRMQACYEFFAREKRDGGAFATFAGVEISPVSRRWGRAAVAMRIQTIGDSCVVLHPASGRDRAFPADPAEYAGRPRLVGSIEGVVPPALCRTVWLSPGDTVLMATDAFARWYLGDEIDPSRAREKHFKTIRRLVRLRGRARANAFKRWLDAERDSDRLENDDVTVVWIEIGRAQTGQEVTHAGR